MAEPIVVILQTWERTEYMVRTIRAAIEHLHYPDVRWYLADDGSRKEHVDTALLELSNVSLIGWHSERRGYGGNINTALRASHSVSALVLPLEDDWVLTQPLDLYPYACLLMEASEIGMVRLGNLNLDIRGRTWGYDGRVYWKLDREPHIEGTPVFTGHPSLRHRRYLEAYGPYPEGLTPGDTELAYAYQFRMGTPDAPGIVWPAEIGAGNLFGHIGKLKTEDML